VATVPVRCVLSAGEEGDGAAGGAGGGEGGAFVYVGGVGALVEDEQGAAVEAEAVEVMVELFQALVERVGLAFAPDLEFGGLALYLAGAVGGWCGASGC